MSYTIDTMVVSNLSQSRAKSSFSSNTHFETHGGTDEPNLTAQEVTTLS